MPKPRKSMTLQQLIYFLAAVEHGSFSVAAEALYIAQPSLSEQIKRLENELGVTLFVRTNRRLVLTEAGQLFLPSAQRAVAAAGEAAESVRGIRTLTGGTVAFGTFSTAQHLFLTDLIAEFRARHPQVRVRVVGLNSSGVALDQGATGLACVLCGRKELTGGGIGGAPTGFREYVRSVGEVESSASAL